MILITGPESTGKTTLAKLLSQATSSTVIPDYSRMYLDALGRDYNYDDIEKMAIAHHTLIENSKDNSLILDTFLLNYKIWSEYKYGRVSQVIITMLTEYEFEHVFLLKPDIAWEPDPLRENPYDREELFELYVSELDKLAWNYNVIDGHGQDRLSHALKALEE